jgi:diguanylate cyclase (GGDEF)-like protein
MDAEQTDASHRAALARPQPAPAHRPTWKNLYGAVVATNVAIGVALGIAVLVLVLHMRNDALRRAANDLQALTLVLADQAERAFDAAALVQTGILDRLATPGPPTADDVRTRMTGRAVFDELQSRIHGLPQIEAVSVIDDAGNLLTSTLMWPFPSVNVADHDYYRALAASASAPAAAATFIGAPLRDRGRATVAFARKVTGPDGGFAGLILAAMRLDYFAQLYKDALHEPGRTFALYRRDGVMLAGYPSPGDRVGQSFAGDPRFRHLATDSAPGEVVRATSLMDGEDRLLFARALPRYPLVVSATITPGAALRDWHEQATALAAATALLEVLIALGARSMLRQVRHHRLLSEANAAASRAEAERLNTAAQLAVARERERAAQEIALQNSRFELALSNMSHGLCLFDEQDCLIVANQRFCEIYGLAREAAVPGTSLEHLLAMAPPPGTPGVADLGGFANKIRGLIAAGAPAGYTRELPDGRTLEATFRPVPGRGWLVVINDITERRRAEAQIVHMAHHDALTGLPNRVLFHDRLENAVARSRRGEQCSVMCLDLDHFKAVNDTLGHPVGDALLQAVTHRVQQHIRQSDLVARLGGDEFAIVQTGVDQPANATVLATRLIEAVSAPYDILGHQVVVGVSIGIAVAPADGEDPVAILKSADMALYGAKADGRGCYRFFEPEMDRAMQERRRLEIDLRRAVEESEFDLHYQPLMNLRAGTVSTLEALLRWNHPERGCVPPDRFVPLAEEIGLINRLGVWVLRRACQDAATWPDSVKVAVNVSAAQFASKTLVADVAAALAAANLPPDRLELEITESVMLEDAEAALVILRKLRSIGVGIAMDDFGTGYSSLSYLMRFPFTKVKIDRAFITGLGAGGDCEAIISAVTGLCETIGMTTVAEGVETREQLDLLRSGKCTEAQGFLFSAGRPASDVASMFAALGAQRETASLEVASAAG